MILTTLYKLSDDNDWSSRLWYLFIVFKPSWCGMWGCSPTTSNVSNNVFSGISKNHLKIDSSFQKLLTYPSSVRHSRFCLIISEQKFWCKSQGTGVEKELFRTKSDKQAKWVGL